ncbi:MAG: MBL fold metallo-hydrolase, partial [Myxococcota bacterium]
SVLMGGDISITDQITIPGAMIPEAKPDVVVIESTYGGRLHASRAAEERRLVQQTLEVLERKGSILFPAFAVGRAQEIILILSRAMDQGEIPKVPMFVDGMVNKVCSAYRSYPTLLTRWLRKRSEHFGDPFFPSDGMIVPVYDPQNRETYARTHPSIIVSSSGMLSGGPSPFYAAELAKNKKNFIAITGYQDEEAPGRRVQEVARAGGGELKLYNRLVSLHCGVGTYGLSAHADTQQIVTYLSALKPKQVALVHGDHGAREALQKALQVAKMKKAYLPCIGDTLEVQPRKRRKRRVKPDTLDQKELEQLNLEQLRILAQKLLERDGPGRFYTLPEMHTFWGIHQQLEQMQLEKVSGLFCRKVGPFKQDRRRPFLYRLRLQQDGSVWEKPPQKVREARQYNQHHLQRLIKQMYPEEEGVYRLAVDIANIRVKLYAYFPDRLCKDTLERRSEKLFTKTGWRLCLHDQPHHQRLLEEAKAHLPEDWSLRKNPSLHIDTRQVVLHVGEGHGPIEDAKPQQQAFLEKTGYTLAFQSLYEPTAQVQRIQDKAHAEEDMQEPTSFSHSPNNQTPMEINQAFALVRAAFAESEHPLLKVALKGQDVEVAFITPEIGVLYREKLSELSEQIGRSVTLKPQPDQFRLIECATESIPHTWALKKRPGFHPGKKFLTLKCAAPPSQEELQKHVQSFHQQTGYTWRLA